ncbi:serine/arginine repetitive matrix protein 1-like [Melia azedarach]|uniref:Serine/arginine repetitive matrix protein 1-like n=1 Tax=Melia azedarach TaxID=155640 RepID=A0ACC1Z296_MELAZ|nr:serine/arginine repetitive matrix protein 1-like [Melia azedarach]
MGCCISSDDKKNPQLPNAASKPPLGPEPDKTHVSNRAPPPSLEEETVKEVVLSETRLIRPQTPKENTTTHTSINEEYSVEAKDLINKHEEETSQVSQVSEIYSISESFSTTTTATTTTAATIALAERKEDEATSKLTTREVNHRSPATKVPRKRPNATEISRGTKSPARRAETSRVMTRSVTGRTMHRSLGSTTGVRRDNGEGSSVRRLRSTAGRTTSTGDVARSPGKVTEAPGGRLRVENAGTEQVNDGVLKEKSELNESLDNPHVSLECFIFL